MNNLLRPASENINFKERACKHFLHCSWILHVFTTYYIREQTFNFYRGGQIITLHCHHYWCICPQKHQNKHLSSYLEARLFVVENPSHLLKYEMTTPLGQNESKIYTNEQEKSYGDGVVCYNNKEWWALIRE